MCTIHKPSRVLCNQEKCPTLLFDSRAYLSGLGSTFLDGKCAKKRCKEKKGQNPEGHSRLFNHVMRVSSLESTQKYGQNLTSHRGLPRIRNVRFGLEAAVRCVAAYFDRLNVRFADEPDIRITSLTERTRAICRRRF